MKNSEIELKYITAGGYPYALEILGRQLVDMDTDGNITSHDWEEAIPRAALELQAKDFFDFYSFTGKQTNSKKVMNILALGNGHISVSKTKLQKAVGKGIYRNLNQLLGQGIIKEDNSNGYLSLQSKLLSSAISFYLKSQQQAKFLQEAEAYLAKIKAMD